MTVSSFSNVMSALQTNNLFKQGHEIVGDQQDATTVHRSPTHKTGPFGTAPNQTLVKAGAEFIARSIDSELGASGAGERVLSKLGLSEKVTIGDLQKISAEVMTHKLSVGLGATSHDQSFDSVFGDLAGGGDRTSGRHGNHSVCFSIMADDTTRLYEHHVDKGDRAHKTFKFAGFDVNTVGSGMKKQMGLDYVTRALDNSLDTSGIPPERLERAGVKSGAEILDGLGIEGRIKMKDLPRVKAELETQQAALQDIRDQMSAERKADVTVRQMEAQRAQPQPAATTLAAFSDGSIHVGEDSRVKVSSDGSGGVVLVRNQSDRDVALKLEHPFLLRNADFVSSLVGAFESNGVDLPVGVPHQEVVQLAADTGEGKTLHDKFGQLRTDPASDGRTVDKAEAYQRNLEDFGLVGKLEMLDGEEAPKYPIEVKAELLKSDFFGKELGKAAVASALLGLRDHVSLPGLGENTNMENVFIGPDGRVSLIDLDPKWEMQTDPETGRPKTETSATFGEIPTAVRGHTDRALTDGIGDLVRFLERAVGDDVTADALLSDELAGARSSGVDHDHPLSRILNTSLVESKTAGLVGPGEGARLDELLSDDDRKAYVAKMMEGAIEGLAFLRENADALATAYKGVPDAALSDPDKTFGDLEALIGGKLQTIQDDFAAKYGGYL